ncbi:FixH family protein [Bosea sp. (in: a-proteobacteria)]|nr:FixH family protein [Bosea sp. (in: a-proteobacteria)]TAJ28383.1 MAG: nitrogen fixation protein FixH [Bosea sp. (in: a-proteobacteria)]SIR17085.1 Nitrogen fixation protein FixH [Bosea sp. TND4EK4]
MSCCGVVIMPLDLPAAPPLPRRPFEVTGRLVLGSLVGFFLVVAGVNATMMTFAIRTMPGLDVKSAYESSQRFNSEFDRMRTQDQRGWQAEGTARRQGEGAVISLRLRDRLGAPITGLAVEAALDHPATHALDRQATLRETAPGTYTASLDAVHAGRWHLAITATRAGETVFVSQNRIVLKD